MKTKSINIRLTKDLYDRLKKSAGKPLSPSMTKIIERGIELALKELDR